MVGFLSAQQTKNEDIEIYRVLFENVLLHKKDTVAINLEYVPSTSWALHVLKEKGEITIKEKRMIELAFERDKTVLSDAVYTLRDSIEQRVSQHTKDTYTKYYFSKPVNLLNERKAIFVSQSTVSKIYSGGKAIGCNIVFFLSEKNNQWSVDNKICYQFN